MERKRDRFKSAPWFETVTNESAIIGGCGGTGGF